ncbi:unnamed protein product, partial [Amoebophrya sp. A25]|eukprot:GSA25T00009284001.1
MKRTRGSNTGGGAPSGAAGHHSILLPHVGHPGEQQLSPKTSASNAFETMNPHAAGNNVRLSTSSRNSTVKRLEEHAEWQNVIMKSVGREARSSFSVRDQFEEEQLSSPKGRLAVLRKLTQDAKSPTSPSGRNTHTGVVPANAAKQGLVPVEEEQ